MYPVSVVCTRYHKGWPEPYICTVYDRMYGDFPAKNTVCTPYIPTNVWFWPTLGIFSRKASMLRIPGVYIQCRPTLAIIAEFPPCRRTPVLAGERLAWCFFANNSACFPFLSIFIISGCLGACWILFVISEIRRSARNQWNRVSAVLAAPEPAAAPRRVSRVGQDQLYTMYRNTVFWQGNRQIYGVCMYSSGQPYV